MKSVFQKLTLITFIAIQFFSFSSHALIELDPNSTFIAAVLEVDGEIEVWINTREYWQQQGALVDMYSEEEAKELEPIIDRVNLCSLAESQYQPCGPTTIDEITTLLERSGIMMHNGFQKWAEQEVGL